MHRIDDSTAAASLPTPAAAGTPGYFTEGNPGGAVPATVVSADWANAVQEELMGVIEAAGLSGDKTDNGQLLAAMQALFGSAIVYTAYDELATGFEPTTVTPYDGSVPQITDGDEILSIARAALSATNKIRIRVSVPCRGIGNEITIAIHKSGTNDALNYAVRPGGSVKETTSFEIEITPGDTTSYTYSVRVGASGGGVGKGYVCGDGLKATMVLEEIGVGA